MDFGSASAEVLGNAIADVLDIEVDYAPVPSDGAARAASIIAEVL
jgi:hypothetical protein